MISCTVQSDVEDMRGKRVLVFLRPQAPQADYLAHPWQQLDISSGAIARFAFEETVSASILTGRPGVRIQSAKRVVMPGQLLLATRQDRLAPELELAPSSMAVSRLMPQQYGVCNQTYPYISVDCVWQVSGSPVVTMPNLDWGMTCMFAYQPVFYFMIATPMPSGESFTALAFDDMTAYALRSGISTLDVNVARKQGRWTFNFVTDLDEQDD